MVVTFRPMLRAFLGAAFLLLLCFRPTNGEAGPSIPPLTGRVVDLAHVLNPSTIEVLTRRLESVEQQGSNQIVVVTLPGLQGYSVEDWGLALLRGWGIGQKDRNNGVVFLVAPNDRQVRIEVGYGLEGALPDATAHQIIQQEIIPHFKANDIGGGVAAGVGAIIAAIDGTYRPTSPAPTSRPMIIALFAILGLLILGFVIWSVRSGRERYWDAKKRRYVSQWPTSEPDPSPAQASDTNSSGFTWGSSSDHSWSSGGSFGGGSHDSGFHGGGGSGGGGGASGRW